MFPQVQSFDGTKFLLTPDFIKQYQGGVVEKENRKGEPIFRRQIYFAGLNDSEKGIVLKLGTLVMKKSGFLQKKVPQKKDFYIPTAGASMTISDKATLWINCGQYTYTLIPPANKVIQIGSPTQVAEVIYFCFGNGCHYFTFERPPQKFIIFSSPMVGNDLDEVRERLKDFILREVKLDGIDPKTIREVEGL